MDRNWLFLMNPQQNKMFPECKHCKMLQKNYSNRFWKIWTIQWTLWHFCRAQYCTDGQ